MRHGLSAHRARGWHTSTSVRAWLDAYAQAGIAGDDVPPAALVAVARDAGTIIASDLPRALESARRLAGGRDVATSVLLREAPMTVPELRSARLPLSLWALLMAWHWQLGRRRGTVPSPALRAQVDAAASELELAAGAERTVLVVTHATIRSLIAAELVRRAWTRAPAGSRYGHWGAWTFDRSLEAASAR